jgi:hypothetical protein
MPVYDRTSHKIGTVECVYLGAVSEQASQHGGGGEAAMGDTTIKATFDANDIQSSDEEPGDATTSQTAGRRKESPRRREGVT